MPLPLVIPIAAGIAGLGIGAGVTYGATKKDETVNGGSSSFFPSTAPFSIAAQTYAPETHSPYEQYSAAVQYAPVTSIQYPGYAINIESPGATATTRQTQEVVSEPRLDYSAKQSGDTAGIDSKTILLVALIAAGAVVAYGVLS